MKNSLSEFSSRDDGTFCFQITQIQCSKAIVNFWLSFPNLPSRLSVVAVVGFGFPSDFDPSPFPWPILWSKAQISSRLDSESVLGPGSSSAFYKPSAAVITLILFWKTFPEMQAGMCWSQHLSISVFQEDVLHLWTCFLHTDNSIKGDNVHTFSGSYYISIIYCINVLHIYLLLFYFHYYLTAPVFVNILLVSSWSFIIGPPSDPYHSSHTHFLTNMYPPLYQSVSSLSFHSSSYTHSLPLWLLFVFQTSNSSITS